MKGTWFEELLGLERQRTQRAKGLLRKKQNSVKKFSDLRFRNMYESSKLIANIIVTENEYGTPSK